jgi:hypothetical protein
MFKRVPMRLDLLFLATAFALGRRELARQLGEHRRSWTASGDLGRALVAVDCR